MKNNKMHTILNEIAEEGAPAAEIDLWKRLSPRLAASEPRNDPNRRNFMKTSRLWRRAALATLAVVIGFAILLATPQGHAFANRLFQFFNVTDAKSFPIPTDQVYLAPATPVPASGSLVILEPIQDQPAASPQAVDVTCSTAEAQAGYFCQVKAAEQAAGFDAREFLYDPRGMKFEAVTYNAQNGEISMAFEVLTGGGYLYLRQGITNFPPEGDTWGTIPADAVEQVSVNGAYAELASGTYVVYPNATSAVWEPGGQLSLVWREGDHWFVLQKMGDPYPIEWISGEELIKLAEGLVDARPADAVPLLDPEYLSTVEQAEALAGFDIPAPELLPAGYELKRVVWTDNVVRLLYGAKTSSNNTLNIFIGRLADRQDGVCPECPTITKEEVRVGDWQGWYVQGNYSTEPATSGQAATTPSWDPNAPTWHLEWNTDELWFNIFFIPDAHSGEQMNQEILVRLAESMK